MEWRILRNKNEAAKLKTRRLSEGNIVPTLTKIFTKYDDCYAAAPVAVYDNMDVLMKSSKNSPGSINFQADDFKRTWFMIEKDQINILHSMGDIPRVPTSGKLNANHYIYCITLDHTNNMKLVKQHDNSSSGATWKYATRTTSSL